MKHLTLTLIAVLLATTGCACAGNGPAADKTRSETDNAKVVVMNFHSKQRCATCIAIEEAAREVIETQFSPETEDGTLVLKVIDISDRANRATARHYQVTWSSLIIEGRNDSGTTVINMTEEAFAKARTAPEEFKARLAETIKSLL